MDKKEERNIKLCNIAYNELLILTIQQMRRKEKECVEVIQSLIHKTKVS